MSQESLCYFKKNRKSRQWKEDNAEWVPPPPESTPRRQVSIKTAMNIVRLVDNGLSEKSVQKKYPWYKRQHLSKFRRVLAAKGSESDRSRSSHSESSSTGSESNVS